MTLRKQLSKQIRTLPEPAQSVANAALQAVTFPLQLQKQLEANAAEVQKQLLRALPEQAQSVAVGAFEQAAAVYAELAKLSDLVAQRLGMIDPEDVQDRRADVAAVLDEAVEEIKTLTDEAATAVQPPVRKAAQKVTGTATTAKDVAAQKTAEKAVTPKPARRTANKTAAKAVTPAKKASTQKAPAQHAAAGENAAKTAAKRTAAKKTADKAVTPTGRARTS